MGVRKKLNGGRLPEGEMAANIGRARSASCAKCAGDDSEWRFCRRRFLGRGYAACGTIRNWAGSRPKCGADKRRNAMSGSYSDDALSTYLRSNLVPQVPPLRFAPVGMTKERERFQLRGVPDGDRRSNHPRRSLL